MPGPGPSPRAALRRRQEAQLHALLTAIRAGNAFQRRRNPALGLPGAPLPSLESFTREHPFTLKTELAEDQRAHPPFGSNLSFPLERYTRCHQTSGTAGVPLRWLDTPADWDALTDAWAEVFAASGVVAADRVFFAFSFGPFLGFWMAFAAAERLGCLCIPGGGMTSRARLQSILDLGATVLCCTPTYALHLAESAAREGVDLATSRVRRILVAGEPGGSVPSTRRRIEESWPGAQVADHHGMTEVGPVTYECPARAGVLHVIEEHYLAEIIDPSTGRPVDGGSRGELVLTPLRRHGSPLLRYRTGDLVQPRTAPDAPDPAACACGRHELALDGGILGRVDDMVIVRGVNIFPGAVDAVVRRFAEVVEYQVQVRESGGLTEMTVEVEVLPGGADPAGIAAALERTFEVALSLRVPVHCVSPGTLPRFEMKARRWVRL